MKTIIKCLVGGVMIIAGVDSIRDGADILANGENSRAARTFNSFKNKLMKKNSPVSVDTVDFTVEDE